MNGRGGYALNMSSMGDLGRQFERIAADPQAAHPRTELDELEKRLNAFLAWGRGRPDRDIRDRFREDFGGMPLEDDHVEAINAGRDREVRSAVSKLVRDPSQQDGSIETDR
jgi:hypothetical protein